MLDITALIRVVAQSLKVVKLLSRQLQHSFAEGPLKGWFSLATESESKESLRPNENRKSES